MKHYYVQHGKALTKDIDATRPLSPDGIEETRAIAKHLANNNIAISYICHSTKERAMQTAQLFAKELAVTSVKAIDGLSPNDDVIQFTTSNITDNTADTMYIGHLPHLDKLVAYLLTGDETQQMVTFISSAVVCLETTNDNVSLLWLKTPTTI